MTLVSPRMLVLRSSLCTAALAATLALLAVPSAHAQVVFDNGGPSGFGYFYSDPGTPQYLADTFTFSATTSFTSVQWAGVYGSTNTLPAADNFTISFFNTTGGVPNISPIAGMTFSVGNAVNRTPTGITAITLPVYQYSATLATPVSFLAGTYGISIVNDTSGITDNWAWAASNTSTGTEFYRFSPTSAFTTNTGELSFRLTNGSGSAAPEPGSLVLLGIGLAGTAGRLRRRRNRARPESRIG